MATAARSLHLAIERVAKCPVCDARVDAGGRFCMQCGARLSNPNIARDGAGSPRATAAAQRPVSYEAQFRFDTDVYCEPSTRSTAIFRATNGETVKFLGTDAGFARLDVDGVVGYVPSDALRRVASAVRAPARPSSPPSSASSAVRAPLTARTLLPWGSFILALIVAYMATQPWGKLLFLEVRGTQLGQGKAVLAFGLLAAGIALFRALGARNPLTSLAQLACALIALACAGYVLNQFMSDCGQFQNLCAALIGDGLWSAVLFSAALAASSAAELVMDLNALAAEQRAHQR